MLMVALFVALAGAVLCLPAASELWSVRTLRRRRTGASSLISGATYPRFLFLVPAHNEELLLKPCLRSLQGIAYPVERMQVVVIADNCTDATATVAESAGAICLVRNDVAHRGKPWAIAWALERLQLADYDAVVVVDADSIVAPDFAAKLARSAPLTGKVLQPYIDVSNREDNSLTRMAAILSAVRFRIINEMKARAGLNVPLGNGLCIGTQVLAEHGWRAFSICEDWELYAILTIGGVHIEAAPAARIGSQEARSLRQSSSQRQRWTAGKHAVLLRYVGGLLSSPRLSLHQRLDALAELSAPGPAVQLGMAFTLIALASLLKLPGAAWLTAVLLIPIVRIGSYTIAAILMDGEPLRAALSFVYLPVYTIWRMAIQIRSLMITGDSAWVRTERHSAPTTEG
jgi:cellulose synthase/poly-beta-1,6-N-acetylglucosamine synthase-like glycosyltransferase